ncbi:DUF2163 domain-containing protein [Novosphingopyxis sp.]|uniref:DUF2163 domain-containing protein n=1 Tax=Novosphingopyxis sp. TaxID=2709690 RepID=UPI003B5AF101
MTHWLDEPCATTAFAWTLRRRDGVALGFTSHDRDLVIDGLLHRAGPGMVPSAIVENVRLDADGLDVDGGLTSDAISEADLNAGRWDGAALEIRLVDWTDPSRQRQLASGELGEISRGGNAFKAELRGPGAALDRPVAPRTSPGCRADFGGAQCGVDLMRHRRERPVILAEQEQLDLSGLADGALYRFGRLRFLSGRNTGTIHDIADGKEARIWLTQPPALAVEPGTRVLLSEGCDRSIATCAARFANAVNFRGEPHLPGNDLLTRYPGGR